MVRQIPILFVALALLAGCKGRDAAEAPKGEAKAEVAEAPADPKAQLVARLVGDWRLDLDTLDKDPQIAKLPPQQRMQALAMARQMMADVTFSFSEDGRVRLGFGPTGRVGTYTVDKVEGNALHLTTRTKQGEEESVEQVVLRIEGDAMWATEGADGRTIRLLRGKPPIPSSQPTGQSDGLPPGHPPANGPAAPGSQPSMPRPAAPGSQPSMPRPAAPGSQPSMPRPAPASQPKMPPPQPAQ